jgi:polynucleotide 5'-kinase involved in rRNA processing
MADEDGFSTEEEDEDEDFEQQHKRQQRLDAEDAKPQVIFVVGGPGSGKGALCSRLARDFGLQHITTSDQLQKESTRADSPFAAAIST